MRIRSILAAGLLLVAATPAVAGTVGFSGTFTNANLPAATGGRCANLTVTIANGPSPLFATGTSNFGAFTSSQSHCLDAGPPIAIGAAATPYYDGLFAFTFATGDVLSGIYSGLLTNTGSTGLVNNAQSFTITGGSGLFAGATGSFSGTGQLRFVPGAVPVATLTIAGGSITAPALPEPSAWMLMLTGFGVSGLVLRRRRQRTAVLGVTC